MFVLPQVKHTCCLKAIPLFEKETQLEDLCSCVLSPCSGLFHHSVESVMMLLGTAKPSLTISKPGSIYNLLSCVWPFIPYLGFLTTRDLTPYSNKDPASKNPMLQLCSGQGKHSLHVSCLYWPQAQSVKSFPQYHNFFTHRK